MHGRLSVADGYGIGMVCGNANGRQRSLWTPEGAARMKERAGCKTGSEEEKKI